MVEFGLLGAQIDLYVAQAFAIGQLHEGHAQILIETLEALDRVTAAIARVAAPEAIKGRWSISCAKTILPTYMSHPPIETDALAEPAIGVQVDDRQKF